MAVCTLEHYPTHEAARMRLAKLELAEPVVAVVEQPDGTLAGGSLLESARALVKAGLAAEGGLLNPNFIQLPMAIETARRVDPGGLLDGPGGKAYEEAVGRLPELCRMAAAAGNAELVKVARLAERVLGMRAGG